MAGSHIPSCPRCGYDQSGVIASWVESCPLHGTCSECGLAFDWREVMNADQLVVPGFYEHTRALAVRSAWRTWLWTWWPGVFWARIRLEHPVRLRRTILWLVILVAFLQLTQVAFDSWAFWKMHASTSSLPPPPRGFPTTVAPDWSIGVVARWLDPIFGSPEHSYLYVNGTKPTSPFCFQTVVKDLFAWLQPGWREWPEYAVPTLCFSLALPTMLFCLSDTRKISKIRPIHIFRALIYSQGWLIVLAVVRLLDQSRIIVLDSAGISTVPAGGFVVRPYSDPVFLPWLRGHAILTAFGLSAWLSVWWWFAVSRGFRVERFVTVFVAMLVPALLVLTIAGCLSSFAFGIILDNFISDTFRH